MNSEVKSLAHFQAQKDQWQVGDGLRVSLRRGVKKLVEVLPSKFKHSALGLFREPLLSSQDTDRYRTWLLASSVFQGSHDGWVSHYEGYTHPVLWLGDCKINQTNMSNLVQLRFDIRKNHIKQALQFPSTEDETLWLLSRFSPRLFPASIRWNPERVLQIWIPL